MIDILKYDIFSNNLSALKELSKDTSDKNDIKYMTESSLEAVNFDHVKTEYVNNLGLSEELARSIDALAFINNETVFIEFKNGNMQNEKQSIKHKVKDSLLILCDIIKSNISYTRHEINFILVYNKEKNSRSHKESSKAMISNHIMEQANAEKIKFGLEVFKDIYFKEVHTYSEAEFEEYLCKNVELTTT